MMEDLILAINTGSTSTKLGLFAGDVEIFVRTINHSSNELVCYKKIIDQLDLRLRYILEFLKDNKIEINDIKAVVGRGGLIKPIPGGIYEVNEQMLEDLKSRKVEEHASNLGGVLARALADKINCPAYIVDPVMVDELEPVARISGMPELARRSIFHALNQKLLKNMPGTQIRNIRI